MPSTFHGGGATKFAPSSRRNACPVCGRVKDEDCRISPELVLCHKNTDHKVGDVIDGWAFTGVSSDGRTGKFTPHKPLEKHPETLYGYSETQRSKRYYRDRKKSLLSSTWSHVPGSQELGLPLGRCTSRTKPWRSWALPNLMVSSGSSKARSAAPWLCRAACCRSVSPAMLTSHNSVLPVISGSRRPVVLV